ncbi:MAG: glycosyltransferase family 2 protein [Planctomycetes bacterium]|nr:glycosyltransferase family 2 protein [Planctomycetota bacterium]
MTTPVADYTIVIPAYNEEESLRSILPRLIGLEGCREIVVVDDGSTDRTADVARELGATVVRHPSNRGYGAALKTGTRQTSGSIVVWFDADGEHPEGSIAELVRPVAEDRLDANLGRRRPCSPLDPVRLPGRWLLVLLGRWITRRRIPDMNCGLRCFRRDVILSCLDRLPDGFSASSTSTILLFQHGFRVGFHNISCGRRTRRSALRCMKDGVASLRSILSVVCR